MKKRNPSDLSILIVLLLLSLLALCYFSESDYHYISFVVLMVSAVAMHFLSVAKNFIWLLTIVLMMGFGMLIIADSSLVTQVQLIKEYLFFTAAMILMWLIYNETKQINEQLIKAQEHAKELEKYIGSSELLTLSEFINRIMFITTGTKRRGEENYYVRFQLNSSVLTQEAFETLFSQTLLATIRTQFDLVTKTSEGSYLIFLQNTNQEGCTVVLDRLFKAVKMSIKTESVPVEVEILNETQSNQYIEQLKEGVLI
ncbi:hypothetical protein JTF06_00140 [Desemzia sp. RIT804]|uniref:hypothetical protein n=1 Tax=Desemzia sp. RIT 804 TaxID=2810209 RepID=UPI00194E2896|nr:hypothetical protein [Desemzia sp. RIT 804]MBM6613295.1 hypothetical protein [Desemzia sp. RIT 804]